MKVAYESRTLRRFVIAFTVLATVAILYIEHPWVPVYNYDFDLYYFGGIVERSGSYTDTPRVLALAEAADKDVASAGVYGSPTLVALVFQPLSLLSLDAAHVVWPAITLTLFAVAIRRAVQSPWWPVWLCLALISRSNLSAIGNGNFAVVTVALLLFTYGSLQQNKDRQAGIALGIAIACKLYPAFLLLPLLAQHRTRTTRWTVLTLGALLLCTIPALGWEDSRQAVEQTLDIASYVHPWTENNGIPGAVLHLSHDQELARWTSRLALIASALLVWRLRGRCTPYALFAVAALLMTLSQSISWHLYFGLTMLAILTLRHLRPTKFTWVVAGVSYALINTIAGAEMRFLPRSEIGLPATFGLIVMTLLVLAQVRKVFVDENVASSANSAK
jgi:hypothetical protein